MPNLDLKTVNNDWCDTNYATPIAASPLGFLHMDPMNNVAVITGVLMVYVAYHGSLFSHDNAAKMPNLDLKTVNNDWCDTNYVTPIPSLLSIQLPATKATI